MRLAFITPTKWINQFGKQGDFQLGLAHLMDRVKINDYERALRDTKQEIILDNSLFENHVPEGIDSLLQKALRIKATHFFAPDFLYSAEKTKAALSNTTYIKTLQDPKKRVKLAAVVQGNTESEWLNQYFEFQDNSEVDLIGLSILSIPRCFGPQNKVKLQDYKHIDSEVTSSRLKLLKFLLATGGNKKPVHLLGLGESMEDVIFASKYCPFVVSNDSSMAFQSGLFGKRLSRDLSVPDGKIQEKVNFNLKELTKEQEENIQFNINLIKKQCK